jgi:hypothetical protein
MGSLVGGVAGGSLASVVSEKLCTVLLGVITRGRGVTACVAVGSGLGGWGGGEIGGVKGEKFSEVLYGEIDD